MPIKLRLIIVRLLLLACSSTARNEIALAKGSYAQIVVPFDNPREITESYLRSENTLVITFAKTAPSEIRAFEDYDPNLVKRVILKDLGPTGTEVKLVLRDRNVRAFLKKYSEPFRLTVDLFDESYAEDHDPTTGIPTTLASGDHAKDDSSSGTDVLHSKSSSQSKDSPHVPGSIQSSQGTKRQLLQPTPKIFVSESEMELALQGSSEGLGKAWKDYPPYIYRLQTAAHEGKQSKKDGPSLTQAISSTEMMADFAGKLFNFGQESKALLAYQQVLHRDPTIFDKDALHLWKFAETHLGHANLTLARGYYESLIQKHPASPLADFAKLRILDVSAIRQLQQNRPSDLPGLLNGVASIKPQHNGELAAQLAIRRAYWAKDNVAQALDRSKIPPLSRPVASELSVSYPTVESSRTAFLAGTLLLSDALRKDAPWSRATAPFAEDYFKRFSGPPTEPYRTTLKDDLYTKINENIQTKVADGKLVEAIDDYEALPASMRSVQKNPPTAWALAEAYRKLGQKEKALPLYELAEKVDDKGPARVKAAFWLAYLSGELAAEGRTLKMGADKISRLSQKSSAADKRMEAFWNTLKPDERTSLSTAYREPFEQTITSQAKLRTPSKIVLANWSKALSTPASSNITSKSGGNELATGYSPSGAAVILLSDLAKRFGELGMSKERREALGVLRNMKPKDFEDDKAAKDIWAKQLTSLAEDYRQSNQYLDAGRLFSLVGEGSENWEGRAEALYKGALLLYRAGRRDEALTSFRAAAADTNNLFYANLAKERLAQIE
jgi:tetratricopeptide (TPR) repeat protein